MRSLTPLEKIKQKILSQLYVGVPTDPDELSNSWDSFAEDGVQDIIEEFRCSGIFTGLECESSRHYEAKAVAAKMLDGSWVGWTYWYGGGKHGDPSEVEWFNDEDVYEVNCVEVLKPVKEFSRA